MRSFGLLIAYWLIKSFILCLLFQENYVELEGLLLVKDFLNKEVEEFLIKKIDRKEWTLSQSGRRKQVYFFLNIFEGDN